MRTVVCTKDGAVYLGLLAVKPPSGFTRMVNPDPGDRTVETYEMMTQHSNQSSTRKNGMVSLSEAVDLTNGVESSGPPLIWQDVEEEVQDQDTSYYPDSIEDSLYLLPPLVKPRWRWRPILGAACGVIVVGGLLAGLWFAGREKSKEPEQTHNPEPTNEEILSSLKVPQNYCNSAFAELPLHKLKPMEYLDLRELERCEAFGGKLICVRKNGTPSCHYYQGPSGDLPGTLQLVKDERCALGCDSPTEFDVKFAQTLVDRYGKERLKTKSDNWTEIATDIADNMAKDPRCAWKSADCRSHPPPFPENCDCRFMVISGERGGQPWRFVRMNTLHVAEKVKAAFNIYGDKVSNCILNCFRIP